MVLLSCIRITCLMWLHAPVGGPNLLPGQFNLSPRLRQGGKIKEVPNMRVKITLRCSECKQRNYNTMKNKKNTPDRLELNKYCPFCRKHTLHTETK